MDIAKATGHDSGYISTLLKLQGVTPEEIRENGIKNRTSAGKQVEMLDKKTEEVLQVFSSTREAARYLIKTQNLNPDNEGGYSAHISGVCNGKRKTCQGYKWRYSNL